MRSASALKLALATAWWLAAASTVPPAAIAISAPAHVWSASFGGTNSDFGHSVAADAAGNVYVAGSFQGQVDFGGGNLVSAGVADAFLAKFDASGNHIWSQRFGGVNGESIRALAVDGAGNVYLTGDFGGSIDLGGGVMATAGLQDIFLAKLDATGGHVWSRRFGDWEGDIPASIALGPSGDVHITGFFQNSPDFGGGVIVGAGFRDIFVAKYDSSGNHVWSHGFGDPSHQEGTSVAVDGTGSVFLAANFEGMVAMPADTVTSAGQNDILIARFLADGTHEWSHGLGDTQNDLGALLAADGTGGVFAAGRFRGTVDFGGGNIVSAGVDDLFLARYDASGAHQWSQGFGGTLTDVPSGIVVNGAGNLVLAGLFTGTVDFGGGNLSSADGGLLVAMYDDTGAHQWSTNLGGTGSGAVASSVTIDGNDQVTLAGTFAGSTDFGGGTLTSQAGRHDIFVAALGPGSAVGVETLPAADAVALSAHPNPFGPSVELRFALPAAGPVALDIFDVRGRPVRSLLFQAVGAGSRMERWDGRDDGGRRVASGVYYARVRQKGTVGTARLVLVR